MSEFILSRYLFGIPIFITLIVILATAEANQYPLLQAKTLYLHICRQHLLIFEIWKDGNASLI